MKIQRIIPILYISLLMGIAPCHAQRVTMQSLDDPSVITLCPNAYRQLKRDLQANPAMHMRGLFQLKIDADKAMATPVRAITEKTLKGQSSDPHDYVSLSPYRWPNPDSADGMRASDSRASSEVASSASMGAADASGSARPVARA